MSRVQRNFTDPAEIADYIVDEFAAENKGVAEVIPADRIATQVDEIVRRSNRFDESEFEEIYVDVKDAVLDRDVIIA